MADTTQFKGFKGGLTPKGRRSLTRSKTFVQARKLDTSPGPPPEEPITLEGGITLNRWSSKVWRTLQDLKIDAIPEYLIGRNRELGGGAADFMLPAYAVALEVNGEAFHADAQKEFERLLNRQMAGLRRVELWGWEIAGPSLHQIILSKLGRRPSWSAG